MNVLLISTCFHKLHEEEFVRPIISILKKESIQFKQTHISEFKSITQFKINQFSHIIICGSALKDFEYFDENITNSLNSISAHSIPTLAICAGAQLICKYLKILLHNHLLISVSQAKYIHKEERFGLEQNSTHTIYTMHSYALHQKDIELFQIQHPNKNIIPLLSLKENESIIELLLVENFLLAFFHPEIKNKELILNWLHND